MKTRFDTRLCEEHAELIKTFFTANNFQSAVVATYDEPETFGQTRMLCVWLDEDDMSGLGFMGLKHAGAKNMLDDYLLKCGVPVQRLHAVPAMTMDQAMLRVETLLKKKYENSHQR